VTWWFAYKLPSEVHVCERDPASFKPSKATVVPASRDKSNDGYRYLYYEPGASPGLALSPNDLAPDGKAGAITRTLKQVFENPPRSVGWIAYGDEEPEAVDLGGRGRRSRGILDEQLVLGALQGRARVRPRERDRLLDDPFLSAVPRGRPPFPARRRWPASSTVRPSA
jgi:hypothetical protein